jgi:hypothetical protein
MMAGRHCLNFFLQKKKKNIIPEMSIHGNLKFYQKFFHASIPFLQIDSLDGTFFITGLAKGRMHNSCSSNAYKHTMIVISYQLPKFIHDHTYLITKYKNSLLKCYGDYNIKC